MKFDKQKRLEFLNECPLKISPQIMVFIYLLVIFVHKILKVEFRIGIKTNCQLDQLENIFCGYSPFVVAADDVHVLFRLVCDHVLHAS